MNVGKRKGKWLTYEVFQNKINCQGHFYIVFPPKKKERYTKRMQSEKYEMILKFRE